MDSDSSLWTIALIASVLVFAFASLVGACISSTGRNKVDELIAQGRIGSNSLSALHKMPLGPNGPVGHLTALSFAASLVFSALLTASLTGFAFGYVVLVAVIVLVGLALIGMLARKLSRLIGEPIALVAAPFANLLGKIISPLIKIEDSIVRWSSGQTRRESGSSFDDTESEIPIDSKGEPLDEHEVKMIRAVVKLDQTTAREIMAPRVDIVAIESEASISSVVELMVTGGHSRIPVYDNDLDHIEGIVHARDVLGLSTSSDEHADNSISSIMRPALFIPESKTLEELLNQFQQDRVHMAIVVDEHGGVSGLVTIEDLLEEIVGEIQDEFDEGESIVEPVGDHEYIIDATLGIDDLNELLDVSLEPNGFDTVGGFVYDRLGKIPSPGDSFEYEEMNITVISTAGRRLKRLRVARTDRTWRQTASA